MKRFAFVTYLVCLFIGSIWAVFYSLHTPFPCPDHPIQFYSNHTRDDLKRVYKNALARAQKSIELSIYSLTDHDLLHLLEKRADEGIEVTLFYDPKATPIPLSLQEKCHLFPYKARALMHRKLLVIDEKLTFLGSANLTPSSLNMHDNLVIGIHNHPFASEALKSPQTDLSLPHQSGKLWLLPEANPQALQTLIDHINRAQKKIHVALFTLTHPQLVQALIAAHSRGVKVTCVLDHYTAEGASRQAQETLAASGVTVAFSRGQQLFHHKWVCIDNHTLFFGSANWTRAAFSSNSDCLMKLAPLTKEQRKFMRKIWKIIQLESKIPE